MVIKAGATLAATIADRLRDRRRFRSAAFFYAAALALRPRWTGPDVQLANMLKDAGWLTAAERAYERAIRRRPDMSDTFLQLARLHRLADRRPEAVAAYSRALQLDPGLAIAAAERAELDEEPGVVALRHRLAAILERADRLRDCGDFAAAAEGYREAFDLAPDRYDLALQCANMLKDSGQVDAARALYHAIRAANPGDPEPWIRLGHLANITADKDAARQAFEAALELDPDRDDARHELVMAGEVRHQEDAFSRGVASGRWAHVAGLAGRIDALEAEARRLRSQVRHLEVEAAAPLRLAEHYLAAHPVGAPPVPVARDVLVLVSGEEAGVERIHQVCNGYLDQAHERWRVVVLGGGPEIERAVGRIALSEARLTFQADGDDLASPLEQAGDNTLVLLPAAGAVPDPQALAWLAFAVERTGAWGAVSDAVVEAPGTGGTVPILRDAPDPFALPWSPADLGSLLFKAAPLRPVLAGAQGFAALRRSVSGHLGSDPRLAHVPLPLFRGPPAPPTDPAAPPPVPSGSGDQTIGVVVLTRDNGDDAFAFVSSLRAHATRPERLDIVVVDNGTRDERSLQALDQLRRGQWARVLPLDVAFNWSWLNNEAARGLSTDIVVFANDDMLMLSAGWDETLRQMLQQPRTGIVGAYLIYPDDTIQHAGVLMGWNGSVIHDGLGDRADAPGFLGRHLRTRAVSAVTGAFMAMRRETFEALGGFDDTRLPIAYSDIDACLSVRARGLAVLVTPALRLRHFESKSRGPDLGNPERRARNAQEHAVMESRWGRELEVDRGLNPHWVMATLPLRLLRWPSEERVVSHLERTGRGEAWVLPAAARP